MSDYGIQTRRCRGCGNSHLWQFLDLGEQALPWFVKPGEQKPPFAPLVLAKCGRCSLVQLAHNVDRDLLFRKFWYRSGLSKIIRDDLREIARNGMWQAQLKKGDYVLDIGSNDGTLLKNLTSSIEFQEGPYELVGFEPAENVIGESDGWATIVNDYFTFDKWYARFGGEARPKLVTAIGMFYDVEDPTAFCMDIAKILHPQGVLIIQQNYLLTMLENVTYDNVCHEHLTYFSLTALEPVLQSAGLECYRVELNSINGGSFRTYICPKGGQRIEDNVKEVLRKERVAALESKYPYYHFADQVAERKKQLCNFLEHRGKESAIYGASTRGSTIVQYCNLNKYGLYAVDNNPLKSGHLMPGTDIMIEERTKVHSPKYFILLPHHLREEIVGLEKDYVAQGGKFVLPLPKFQIIP